MIVYLSGAEAMQAALAPVVARQKAESRAAFDAEMVKLARADKARAMRELDLQAARIKERCLAR